MRYGWRGLLLAVLVFGMIGIGIELLLLEHTEEFWQWVPILLLALGIIGSAAVAIRPHRAAVRFFRLVMLLFLVSGAVGLFLHYTGNAEFELEMRPTLGGFELFQRSLMGATPALSPGTMALLGLIGLLYTYGHPALVRVGPGAGEGSGDLR
jgi:hypothetical protein